MSKPIHAKPTWISKIFRWLTCFEIDDVDNWNSSDVDSQWRQLVSNSVHICTEKLNSLKLVLFPSRSVIRSMILIRLWSDRSRSWSTRNRSMIRSIKIGNHIEIKIKINPQSDQIQPKNRYLHHRSPNQRPYVVRKTRVHSRISKRPKNRIHKKLPFKNYFINLP